MNFFRKAIIFIKNSYVNIGIVVSRLAANMFASVLRHLVVVQGSDPNADPGVKDRQRFSQQLNEAFAERHDKSYDDDFDIDLCLKHYKEHQNEMGELNVSQDDFRKLTDVSNKDDKTTSEFYSPSWLNRAPNKDALKFFEDMIEESITPVRNKDDLQEVDDLNKVIDIVNSSVNDFTLFDEGLGPDEIKKLMDRTAQLKEIKKLIKQYDNSTEDLFTTKTIKIKRTPTGKVNAVKSSKKKPRNKNTKKNVQERHANGKFKRSARD